MAVPEFMPDELAEVRAMLAQLRQAEAEQTALLRPLVARSDAVGVERLEWPALIEMAARAEMLRRLHEQIGEACEFLGIPWDPNSSPVN